MRINLDTGRVQKKESAREKLIREGRLEARRELERRFHARTAAWKKTHEVLEKGVSVPHFDQDKRSDV